MWVSTYVELKHPGSTWNIPLIQEFLWSKDMPGFPKAGKIHSKSLTRWLMHLICSGCSPVVCYILPVHWRAPNPFLLSLSVCSATDWTAVDSGVCACVCVCVRSHRTPARWCISQPDSLLEGVPVLDRNYAVHRPLLLWCASAEKSHIPLYSSGTYVPLIHDKTPCIKINTLGREKLKWSEKT